MIKYAAQYLRSAITIIEQYEGAVPLTAFLKQYFKANPKFGSKDRRYISQLCYCYYRTGHAFPAMEVAERIKASLFLCEPVAGGWEILYNSEWLSQWDKSSRAKWGFLKLMIPGTDAAKLFPWTAQLSNGIDAEIFANSHLVQPDLFLRMRPGKGKTVLQKLDQVGIVYQRINETCLSVSNSTKIDTILAPDSEVVVQDLNSQRVADFFPGFPVNTDAVSVWDCCAASGGKSILAYDVMRNIQLSVSDIRASIIRNLKQRFERAGIKSYHSFVADISLQRPAMDKQTLVICDAPCSGSGTWGRTPEQLYFFSEEKIDGYAGLQRKILANVIPYVAEKGYLLYITCSVFKKENEEAVSFIQGHSKLTLIKMALLKGYEQKADSMFAALFQLKG